MLRRPAVVAALVVMLGLVVLALVLTRPERRLAGSANAAPGEFVTNVAPGQRTCQGLGSVPVGTGIVRLLIGTYGRPRALLQVSVLEGRRIVAASGVTPVPTGSISLRLRPTVRANTGAALVCLRNAGTGKVAVAGVFIPVATGEPRRHVLSLAFLRPGRASAWSQVPAVLDRYSASRGGLSSLWLVLAALSFTAGAALGIGLIVRGDRP